jgi:hypothetical protein
MRSVFLASTSKPGAEQFSSYQPPSSGKKPGQSSEGAIAEEQSFLVTTARR